MNLVGKIFVVVIFVLSLVFMSLTMAVYATHRNWRDVVLLPQEKVGAGKELGLKFQLEKLKSDNANLKDQKDKLEKDTTAELAAKKQALVKLENELAAVTQARKSLEAGRATLEKEKSDAVAAMSATQIAATGFRQEVEEKRAKLLKIEKEADAAFKEIGRKTDELNQAVNDKELLRRRTTELVKDLTRARDALRLNNIDEQKDLDKTPPKVDGIVTSVAGAGLIEISIGSDMGLRKGHTLEVYRTSGGQSTYVGRVEVVSVEPSKAVCKIDTKFQNSQVQVNDRVRSKFE